MEDILQVNKLQTVFNTDDGQVICVDDVSFSLKPGEIIGVVGESGCGKSVTSLSIIGLLGNKGKVNKGEVYFEGRNLLELNEKQMRKIRGNKISMIFQEPMTSLNPILTIGDQITESIRLHLKKSKSEALKCAVDMLEKVGLPRADKIINDYPHVLSGGMRQRVMIAMALVCNPKLIIADEPTTALDVTIQAQILDLMKKLSKEFNTAIMLITHDLGVIAEMVDKVLVMYAGQVVEEADVYTLFENPKHPYTQGLMKSIPQVYTEKIERLIPIPGTVPSVYQKFSGCRFNERCILATERCRSEVPRLVDSGNNHKVRCWNYKETSQNR
ncbi:ABC transporter ATP-binding protein [Clostridium sp.]|jgi:peptide/nickel transport system ATP-binding protein|uniref:ABC transporter ATP-binding protein n=1 Tax=Clostridium sp. TaxID=1506 RepID=UPI003EEE3CCD